MTTAAPRHEYTVWLPSRADPVKVAADCHDMLSGALYLWLEPRFDARGPVGCWGNGAWSRAECDGEPV
jgi:hypothetical protein